MLKLSERLLAVLPVVVLAGLGLFLAPAALERMSFDYLTAAPLDQGRAGGIGPTLVNTLAIVGAGLALAVPPALAGAVLYVLAEGAPGPWARGWRALMEVGVSLPRLLWGLAGAAVFGGLLGLGVSALTGALTLACLLAPILATGFLEALGRAWAQIGPAAAATGVAPLRALLSLGLREARPALLVALSMAMGRGFGDAAALLLTAGIGLHLLGSPAEPASTLAVLIYYLAVEIGGGREAAMSAAFVLLTLTAGLQMPMLLTRR
ncbi:MAG: hypothetical protein AAF565_17245 [Pseudomonadota bacterium]